ncbi:hypothetical protein RVBP17_3620 [Pseudomonas phage sp. 30-3]|nr:hypothetical protein RVBP17_3620 [Pseudomonas phage sp. 30-3]
MSFSLTAAINRYTSLIEENFKISYLRQFRLGYISYKLLRNKTLLHTEISHRRDHVAVITSYTYVENNVELNKKSSFAHSYVVTTDCSKFKVGDIIQFYELIPRGNVFDIEENTQIGWSTANIGINENPFNLQYISNNKYIRLETGDIFVGINDSMVNELQEHMHVHSICTNETKKFYVREIDLNMLHYKNTLWNKE